MANCNDEHFCQDKFLLDPKEASLKELVLLLFFSDVQSRKFVDSPEENRLRDINQRWLIFISVLVQKILLSCREPLAQIGHTVEYWLNLISNNGGPFKLLLNYLKGMCSSHEFLFFSWHKIREELEHKSVYLSIEKTFLVTF